MQKKINNLRIYARCASSGIPSQQPPRNKLRFIKKKKKKKVSSWQQRVNRTWVEGELQRDRQQRYQAVIHSLEFHGCNCAREPG